MGRIKGLRSAKEIKEDKKKFNWNEVMVNEEETHLQNHYIQQELNVKYNSMVNNYFVASEEMAINTDYNLVTSLEETDPVEEDVFMDCYTTEE